MLKQHLIDNAQLSLLWPTFVVIPCLIILGQFLDGVTPYWNWTSPTVHLSNLKPLQQIEMEANIIHRCAGNEKRNIFQIEKKDIGSQVLVLNHYKSGWSLVIFMGKEGHMPSNCLKLKPCPSFKGLLNSNESSRLLLNKEAYTKYQS